LFLRKREEFNINGKSSEKKSDGVIL